jgi:hypothetical protein
MNQYAVKFGMTDNVTGEYIIRSEHIFAFNEKNAIDQLNWKHQQVIDTIFIKVLHLEYDLELID